MARAARQSAKAGLAARIRTVHQESDGTHGAPRITAELRDQGERINHKRVARIMRSIGLEGVRLRRQHRTTVADQAAVKAPDLIGRDFTAAAVNTKYVGDITYLPLSGAKPLYLATVIDLASCRLAGWAIADHMRTELVSDALAAAERRGPRGIVGDLQIAFPLAVARRDFRAAAPVLALGVDDLVADPLRDQRRITGRREAEQEPALLFTLRPLSARPRTGDRAEGGRCSVVADRLGSVCELGAVERAPPPERGTSWDWPRKSMPRAADRGIRAACWANFAARYCLCRCRRVMAAG
ncbi:IS3 family transposase [Streptomyces erythrochromogenes]|uniref:IS3 family transposase n=1 Tax=Streptomyces erythrochromogenes TaxID=285574 RepID=UPI0036A09EE2